MTAASDETEQVVSEYIRRHPEVDIRLFNQPVNSGQRSRDSQRD